MAVDHMNMGGGYQNICISGCNPLFTVTFDVSNLSIEVVENFVLSAFLYARRIWNEAYSSFGKGVEKSPGAQIVDYKTHFVSKDRHATCLAPCHCYWLGNCRPCAMLHKIDLQRYISR